MPGTKMIKSDYPDIMIDIIGSHFLEVARQLREVLDDRPEDFAFVLQQLKLGKRKAYALVQIDRTYAALGIDRERLRAVGWTKLALMASAITEDNVHTMLQIAEAMTATELKLYLLGEDIDPDAKVVVLYLKTDELKVFDQVMTVYGATKHPRGWIGKEQALTKALRLLVAEQ